MQDMKKLTGLSNEEIKDIFCRKLFYLMYEKNEMMGAEKTYL